MHTLNAQFVTGELEPQTIAQVLTELETARAIIARLEAAYHANVHSKSWNMRQVAEWAVEMLGYQPKGANDAS